MAGHQRVTESFVTITAHFIDGNWDAQTSVLQTRAMYDCHSGAQYAKGGFRGVEAHREEPAVVIDNTPNMAVAVAITGYLHVRCSARVESRSAACPEVAKLLLDCSGGLGEFVCSSKKTVQLLRP